MPDFPKNRLIGSLVIKIWISTDKILQKMYWNGQGLQQVVEKGDKLSNFCDEIGGNIFLERTRFCFPDRAVATEGISVLQHSVKA